MLVVAIAQSDEIRARIAARRAGDRFETISKQDPLAWIALFGGFLTKKASRRLRVALCSYYEHTRALDTAIARHNRFYQAHVRAFPRAPRLALA